MAEKLCQEQIMVSVTASELLEKVADFKGEGYRMGQICATKVADGIEIIYSFDKDHVLTNLKLKIGEDEEVMSVTGMYLPAFIYENEMQDLFGIKFKHMELNYGGKFFKVSEPTPWNPKN